MKKRVASSASTHFQHFSLFWLALFFGTDTLRAAFGVIPCTRKEKMKDVVVLEEEKGNGKNDRIHN